MTLSRRTLLVGLGLGAAATGLAACSSTDEDSSPSGDNNSPKGETSTPPQPEEAAESATGAMPDEGTEHAATWMSFAVSEDIWGADMVEDVQQSLLDIAAAIAAFEPVNAIVPSGTRLRDVPDGVALIEMPADDLWIRDTGPTFVRSEGAIAGVDFNFNGWGDKQEHAKDAQVAAAVCERAGVPRISTELVLEGGALEVDGEGTAIITESCVLNDNRNPGWTKEQVEAELQRTIGVEKVI